MSSLCLSYSAASASAHSHYTFTGSFGVAGSGAGQMSLLAANAEQSVAGSGVAVNNETHDVYVADTQNNRVDEFESDGAFVRAWGWGVANGAVEPQTCTVSCQKGLSGSAPGEFEAPTYVAVDNSPTGAGDVYIADIGDRLLSKFDQEGKLIESWGVKGQLDGSSAPEGPFFEKSIGVGHLNGIAVDTAGNLWAATSGTVKAPNEHVYEFAQSDSFTRSWVVRFIGFSGIAVDSSDNIYGNTDSELLRYNASGSPIGSTVEGKTIEGKLTSGPTGWVTGVAVDPATDDIYVEAGGSVERFASSCETVGELDQGCVPLESFGSLQSAGGASLAVDSGTGTVYVVKPGSDGVEAFAPEVHRPPAVESQSVAAVTSDSATFATTIDPNGSKTSYRVEYGTSAAYGASVPVPDGLVGSGFEAQEFSLHVQGLAAQTTYHFRVVADNEKGTTYGEDLTFTTQLATAVFGLPDGREWELVTPAEKHGVLFFGQNYGKASLGVTAQPLVGEAAVDGDAMIDLASAPSEAQPQGYSKEVSVLSTRGAAGWSSQVIAPPHKRATGAYLSAGGEYVFFSEDLSLGVVDPFGPFTQLSPEASEPTPYLRADYLNGNVSERCEAPYATAASCFHPLVTAANTQTGVAFGGETEADAFGGKNEPGTGCYPSICGPAFVAGTPDASYLALSSNVQLTATPNEREPGQAGPFYYEWGAGRLQPLYLLPESEGGDGVYAGALSTARNQLSDGGSVFFVHGQHLYLHDFARDQSVRLDLARGVVEPTQGGIPEPGTSNSSGTDPAGGFLYASSDGSRVLFSDSAHLTSAAQGGIYECRIAKTAGLPACELELTSLPTDEFADEFIGGSKDASYLYFEDATGHLIVDHYSGGEWNATSGPYVGTWASSTSKIVGFAGEETPVSEVSPDGRWLTFMSEEQLTGYDNHDALSARPDVEVYLYDAASNRLVCASCNPTGARPTGFEYEGLSGEGIITAQNELAAGSLRFATPERRPRWVAANLPPWTSGPHAASGNPQSLYQPRFLSDSGRLFFNSRDALVPQDVNGAEDVYEWEPPGIGGCTTASAGFSERSGGCVSLISSGSSSEESAFMDASEGGGDVFFITLSQLTSQDVDSALDVYDAHECTVGVPCSPPVASVPPACSTGDGCKAAPTPQPSIFGVPSSATFSGTGNLTPEVGGQGSNQKKAIKKTVRCKHGFVERKVHKRETCVKNKRKQSKKAKKTNRKVR